MEYEFDGEKTVDIFDAYYYFIGELSKWFKRRYQTLVRTTRFWVNLHQVRSKPKYLKVKKLKVFGIKKTKRDSQNRLRSPPILVGNLII